MLGLRMTEHDDLECSTTGRKYTFEEVRVRSRNLSKSIRKKLKLQKDDIVAILLPNIPEYIICCLGIMEAGLVVTTMNPIYTAEEVAKQLVDSDARAIITLNQNNLISTANTAIKMAKKTLPIIAVKEKENDDLHQSCIDFRELVDTNTDMPDFDCGSADRLALLPYSSGTTGLPKGVELTHNNLVSNLCQVAHPDVNALIPANVPGVLPMFHIYGFMVILMNATSYGAKIISMPRFHPELYVSVLKKQDVTRIYAAPPLVLFLIQHPDVRAEYMKNVKSVLSAAAPLGPLDEQQFHEKFGGKITVSQGYGLTETSPLVALYPKKYTEETSSCVTGSIGKLLPNTRAKVVSLDDPTGTPLGPNEQGELLLKGPQIMKGYHNKPQETQDTMLDGWLRTGDIVRYNEDRFLFVTDRLKELIKVKGFQVAPAELEELIRAFPAVEEAAVIGVPHANHGEVPRAYVVPKKDISLVPEELDKFVADKVASYKRLSGGIEVECSETGRKYSYLEVRSKARNLSKYLIKKLKLQKGDVVAILSPNVPEYMITCLGILEAGLVITSMNPIYTVEEIHKQLVDSSAKVIITVNNIALCKVAETAAKMTKKQLPIIAIKEKQNDSLVEGCIDYGELINYNSDAPDFHYTDPDALAFLPYSSGTTGLPKGVELLHRNIVANLCQACHPITDLLKFTNGTFQEIMPVVLPLFHIYGFSVLIFYAGIHGAKLITLPRFTPDSFISILRNNPVTTLYVAPPLEHLKDLKTLVSAAAPLGQSDEDKFKEKFGKHIIFKQGYGLTEMSPIVCSYLNGVEPKANIGGSVGAPIPATLLKVIDPDDLSGTPLGVHQKGEILVKGPQMMKGYHNRPEETNNAFRDGWLRTGDIGHYNEDGFVFITDRLKELIKVKGYQVPPAELEEIIRGIPEVEEAAVIGIPHPTNGEAPRAYVVPKTGKTITPKNVQDYVADKVAKYKQLSGGVAVVQDIPKNPSGKILRRTLKVMFEKDGY
nr:unnamed protein product [Callosobruchus chinensis]